MLVEAECMRRLLPETEFRGWFNSFLPNLDRHEPGILFTPATVSDRGDGKIVHLDGLNLSRAWCMRALAASCAGDLRETVLNDAADAHTAEALKHVAGDYTGEHWLATYALLALSGL
jgi:hypothetical protein